eukprot:366082-Chlamydomonas_euryale.AAC.22
MYPARMRAGARTLVVHLEVLLAPGVEGTLVFHLHRPALCAAYASARRGAQIRACVLTLVKLLLCAASQLPGLRVPQNQGE